MKLGGACLVNGLGCVLLAALVSAACGSDSQRRSGRDGDGGAAGEGGAPTEPAAGGGEMQPMPSAGMGGEPGTPAGGMGGESVGVAGTPGQPRGGEGGALSTPGGGAGGEAGAGGTPQAIDCTTITFDDPNLEQAVREELGLNETDTIEPAAVAAIVQLDASGHAVKDLGGIECLTNVANLDLGYGGAFSEVTNLAPLSYLKQLVTFDCSGCPLESLAPLGELPQLQNIYLSLAVQPGVDLTALATAPALKILDLDSTSPGSLSPLGEIPTLEILYLGGSNLTVPDSLGDLKQLKQLRASSAVFDATPLGKLTQLEYLELGFNPLTNSAALGTLTNLTNLYLGSSSLTSAAFVTNMTKLAELSLYTNDITDLTPLQNLTALERLYLNGNPLANLNALAANTGLATGDFIYLTGVTTLNCTNEAANLAALVGRGATISGNPCP